MSLYQDTISKIEAVSPENDQVIQAHLDDLTKPQGSLGRLEEMALFYCRIRGEPKNPRLGGKRIFTFAADHGISQNGVSAFPREVTGHMVYNMLAGGAAINVLAEQAGAELIVVDIGVDSDLPGAKGLVRAKVKPGTADISVGPAMSKAELSQSLEVGIKLANIAADSGVTIFGTGEMGIGNTTSAAALMAALLPEKVANIVGLGTGIDAERLENKKRLVERALVVNAQYLHDPFETLAALGGLEIAGICGLIFGAAAQKIPVVIDGFISAAAALAAVRIKPEVKEYLLFSHLSAEKGHQSFYQVFGQKPVLDFQMRLGEGTGAALAIMMLEASVAIYNKMATFSGAGVSGKE